MSFEQSLALAAAFGKSRQFKQPNSWCVAFSVRWLKYRMFDLDFWHGPASKAPGKPIFAEVERKRDVTYMTLTPDGARKFGNSYDKRFRGKGSGGASNLAKVEYLARSKKSIRKTGTSLSLSGGRPEPMQQAGRILRHRPYDGFFLISFDKRIENSTAIIESNYEPHAVAAHKFGDRIAFFDPNMGEVILPIENFEQWWETYAQELKRDFPLLDQAGVAELKGKNDLEVITAEKLQEWYRGMALCRARIERSEPQVAVPVPVPQPGVAQPAQPAQTAARQRAQPYNVPPSAPRPQPPGDDLAQALAIDEDALMAELGILPVTTPEQIYDF